MSIEEIQEYILDNKKKVLFGLVLLIILIIFIFYLTRDNTHKELYTKHNLFYNNEQVIVGFENIPYSEENVRYTFSTFVRVNNIAGNTQWNENQSHKKYIIDNSGAPNIIFYRESGLVVIEIAYKNSEGIQEMYEFKLERFPMQKWVGLCVVVNDRIVKIYQDGELKTAKKLDTIPWRSKKMLYIGKKGQNFNGHIGMVDYYNRALDNKSVKSLYLKRIKSLPNEVLSYEQAEYKRKALEEVEQKINTIKKI